MLWYSKGSAKAQNYCYLEKWGASKWKRKTNLFPVLWEVKLFQSKKIRFHLNRSQFFNLRHLSKLFSSLAPIRRLLRRLLQRWKAVKVKAGKLMKSEKTVIRWNDFQCDFFEWMFKWVGGRRLDLSFTMNMNGLSIWTKPIPVNLSVLWSNLLILFPSSHHLRKKWNPNNLLEHYHTDKVSLPTIFEPPTLASC